MGHPYLQAYTARTSRGVAGPCARTDHGDRNTLILASLVTLASWTGCAGTGDVPPYPNQGAGAPAGAAQSFAGSPAPARGNGPGQQAGAARAGSGGNLAGDGSPVVWHDASRGAAGAAAGGGSAGEGASDDAAPGSGVRVAAAIKNGDGEGDDGEDGDDGDGYDGSTDTGDNQNGDNQNGDSYGDDQNGDSQNGDEQDGIPGDPGDQPINRGANEPTDAAGSDGAPAMPPLNARFDYQLGGAYAPAPSVTILERDRTAAPAPGLYNICYVNGFQAQPEDTDAWLTPEYSGLVLHNSDGEPVFDRRWNELLFDVSTAEKREALAQIVATWIAGCRNAGYDAVEIDNLDSYSRSGGLLQQQHAVEFMRLLSNAAHANDMAIAQKNSKELVPRRAEMGTDFAIAEECNRYEECDDYRAGYKDMVLVVEYDRDAFMEGCAAHPELPTVLRDVNLVPAGQPGYLFAGC